MVGNFIDQYFFLFTPVPFLILIVGMILFAQGIDKKAWVRLTFGVLLGLLSFPFVAFYTFIWEITLYATNIL